MSEYCESVYVLNRAFSAVVESAERLRVALDPEAVKAISTALEVLIEGYSCDQVLVMESKMKAFNIDTFIRQSKVVALHDWSEKRSA